MRIKSKIRIALLAAALACLGALAFLGVAVAVEPETIIPGVAVLDADLSGLTRGKADGKLLLLDKEVIQSSPLVLRHGVKAWRLQPGKAGVAIDRDRVLDEAVKVGRQGNVVQRWVKRRQAKKDGVRIPVYIKIDQARLEQELTAVASELAVQPKDAQLKINPDESVEVVPSRDGITVDVEKARRDIMQVFEIYDSIPEISLALVKAGPQRTTRDVMDMGVNGLLASYTTTFDNGDADRSYNIRVAAAALDGLFIAPGEIFSFNEMVGPRSSETGYKNAKVIINNELVEGLGGGVCQVSSTLYNAVLLANMEILDRRNHSLPVSYVPPGRDATVSFDYIDFRFKNSTPRFIFLKTMVSPGRLTVKLYGSSDYRREVTIRTRVVETIPFKEIYKQDPTLGVGEMKLKRKGSPGLRVVSERVVLDNDTYRVENLPASLYNPVDQIVLTWPGFQASDAPIRVEEAEINAAQGQGGNGGETGNAP